MPRIEPLSVSSLDAIFSDAPRLVNMVQEATGLSSAEIARSCLRENRDLGNRVYQEIRQRGVTPYQWSDALLEFYSTTTAFTFESIVWNRSGLKREMQTWVADFLDREFSHPIRVLVFGDGMGFDSAFLAVAGHQVSYFEVSQTGNRFAKRLFHECNCEVEMLTSADHISGRVFDVVVCLDVLEHVPDPLEMVRALASVLAPDGRLIVHAPFWFLAPCVATHLASNRKFSGDIRHLYAPAGLKAVDGALFWNPIVFAPKSTRAAANLRAKLRVALGGALLLLARFWSQPHALLTRWLISRSLKDWPEMERFARKTSDASAETRETYKRRESENELPDNAIVSSGGRQ